MTSCVATSVLGWHEWNCRGWQVTSCIKRCKLWRCGMVIENAQGGYWWNLNWIIHFKLYQDCSKFSVNSPSPSVRSLLVLIASAKHATISFDITAESLTLYLQKQICHRARHWAHKKCENIGFNILSKVQRTFFCRWQANNLGWGGSGRTFLLINWTCRGSFWARQRTWCLRGWGKKRKSMLNVSGNFVTIAPFTIPSSLSKSIYEHIALPGSLLNSFSMD